MHGQIKVSKVIFFLCISFRNFYKIFKKFFALFEHLDNNIFLEINIIIVPHLMNDKSYSLFKNKKLFT